MTTREQLIAYKRRLAEFTPQEVRQPIDLAFDGTPDDEALIIDGVRLVSYEGFENLQKVFYRLLALRNEVVARRGWERDVDQHLANLPARPRSDV